MRLLKCSDDPTIFNLTKNLYDNDIPSYAILSHTWGADHEEVTLGDLADGSARSKAGYQKIQFCG
jgi:hypothetical protein